MLPLRHQLLSFRDLNKSNLQHLRYSHNHTKKVA